MKGDPYSIYSVKEVTEPLHGMSSGDIMLAQLNFSLLDLPTAQATEDSSIFLLRTPS